MRTFASNPDVSFADVMLSENRISGEPHNPGAGGWPTIRYFNKETGYDGANYEKVTTKAMCEELGDDTNMENYVMKAGNTALCVASTGEGCSDREKKYISKWSQKSAEDVASQVTRLEGLQASPMKGGLKIWIKQRLAILNQFENKAEAPTHEEL